MKKLILFIFVLLVTIVSCKKDDSVVSLVKEKFPKIYSVIVNESRSEWPNSRVKQNEMIDKQCFAFSLYFLLIYVDKPTIPRDVLTTIQADALVKHSKNSILDANCDNVLDIFENLDCTCAYMVVDWIDVMYEIKEQIDSYDIPSRSI